MFTPWRFKLRQAQAALDQGRLDEAASIASRAELSEYFPVQQLLGTLAGQFARRALERAAAADLAAAWRDLETARQLAGETSEWQKLQQAVAEVAIGDVLQHLQASDYHGASSRLDALGKRKMPGVGLQTLSEVARRLESSSKLLARGKFPEAEAQLVAAVALRPDLAILDEKLRALREQADRCRTLSEQLHAAIAAAEWTKVASLAGQLLEISPAHRVARDARRRAWAEVGENLDDSQQLPKTHHWAQHKGEREVSASRYGRAAEQISVTGGPAPPASQSVRQIADRLMLWIDAVGGYLVCLGDDVVLGQAVPGSLADIPIQGDLSRRHAKLTRHAEGYVLEPLSGKTLHNGHAITGPTLIADNDEIGLGDAVKLRFRKPHVLSSSARLEMTSGHRTQPFADGVILMAESCVLGPKWQNHVVCRDWGGDVVLYRSNEAIMCRAIDAIEIDGQLVGGRGAIRPGSRVVGTDFSLSIEGA